MCETCIISKQSCLPHRSRESVLKNPLDVIVSDVCCLESPMLNGEKYFVTFLDDCTHFCAEFPIISKSDVTNKFKEFVAIAENRFDCRIKSFRSDNGTEYLTFDLLNFCKDNGLSER